MLTKPIGSWGDYTTGQCSMDPHKHEVETCSPHQSADSGVSWEGCACGEVRRLENGVVDSDGWHRCSICSRYLMTGMS